MVRHKHFEADMFFMKDGIYQYDPTKIKQAHEWCQRQTFNALANGKSVVVSNTFTRLFELEPYFEMAKTFGIEPNIIEATGNWPNVHGVPAEVVEKMRQRWETTLYVIPGRLGTGELDRNGMPSPRRTTP
jgi:hypothetical protein